MGLFSRKSNEDQRGPVEGYAFVNKRLVKGVAPEPVVAGEFPRYLYREQADGAGDSGWRIFIGSETQEEADDPSNFQVSALSTLLALHPALDQVIIGERDGVWEWNDEQARYVPVRD